jgi:hypothetical protein
MMGEYNIWTDEEDPAYDPYFHSTGMSFDDEEDLSRRPMNPILLDDPNDLNTSIPDSTPVDPAYDAGEKNPVTGEPLESGKRPKFGLKITGYDAVPASLVGVADFTSRMSQGQGMPSALVGAGVTATGGLIGDKVGEQVIGMAGRKLAEFAAKKAVGSGVGRLIGGAAGTLLGPAGTIAGSLLGGMVGEGIGGWIGDRLTGANRQPDPSQLATGAIGRGVGHAMPVVREAMPEIQRRSQDFLNQAQQMANQYGGYVKL